MKMRVRKTFPRVGRVVPNAPPGLHAHNGSRLRTTCNQRVRGNAPFLRTAAFTLIEMIGVMAIMAILASVVVPNILKSVDRAAIKAETETLRNLGVQVKLFLEKKGYLPNRGTGANLKAWNIDVATYADLSPSDVLRNPRGINRSYLVDPDPAYPLSPRVLILSNMRDSALALPAGANTAQFDDIWMNGPNAAVFGGTWTGINAEYLLIERVNLQPINLSNDIDVLLNNTGAPAGRYELVRAIGGPISGSVTTTASVTMSTRDTLRLLDSASALQFVYVPNGTSASVTFSFDGTKWRHVP